MIIYYIIIQKMADVLILNGSMVMTKLAGSGPSVAENSK